jgi:hypothetical protein
MKNRRGRHTGQIGARVPRATGFKFITVLGAIAKIRPNLKPKPKPKPATADEHPTTLNE